MNKKRNLRKVREDTVITRTDTRTGEVLGQKKKVNFFPARFDEEKGYLWKPQKSSARMFNDVPFPKKMSMIDRGRMATLAKHIWSKTNMLGYKGHGGIRPYSVEQLGKLIDLNVEQTERFLKRMYALEMIKPIQVPFGERIEIQYYVNPLYFFSNNRLSLNLYLLFREELDKHLPDWVKEEFSKAEPERKTN